MPFYIERNDITKIQVDAIVNAANNRLLAGGGVCGAIFAAAGAKKLQEACGRIGFVKTGEAVITKGFQLPADYIIHTAGPVWRGGHMDEERLLYSSYFNSLELARDHGLKSIAFPLISSGIYGYPKEEAIRVAVRAIGDFLEDHEMHVILVVYDKEAFSLGGHLYQKISAYIDDHYVKEHEQTDTRFKVSEAFRFPARAAGRACDTAEWKDAVPLGQAFSADGLEDMVKNLDESFSQSLLRLIDEKGMTDVETYKKANIDRKLFSKIRKDRGYQPKKTTAVAFAIALELSLEETNDLLGRAGYILSHSSKFDVIIEFFILSHNYNIIEINEALFAFDQILIGG